MSYCLVQTAPVAPSADQLKRAFKSLKSLTEADAVKTAVEACGILVKNLSLNDAGVLQRALQAEGVATELIEAGQLPILPDAKFVRRMAFQSDALLIYDPVGRAVPVPWQHISLISAGRVRHFNLTRTEVVEPSTLYDKEHWRKEPFVVRTLHKVQDDARFILEIFIAGGAMRFQIEAEAFLFRYCFDRPELNLPQKLGLLIQMLAQNAPHSALNRGAVALQDGSRENPSYASKAAFFDESTWLLWRLAKKN